MRTLRHLLAFASSGLLGIWLAPACEDDSCAPGTEFCPCFMGSSCQSGLVCDAGYCVPGSGDSGGDAEGSADGGGCPGACNAVGDPCEVEGTVVCGVSADGTRTDLLNYCENGVLVERFQCPSPQPCSEIQGNTSVHCGNDPLWISYALEDGPCANEGGAACNFDQTVVLLCEQGTWLQSLVCEDTLTQCDRLHDGDNGVMCSGGAEYCIGCA